MNQTSNFFEVSNVAGNFSAKKLTSKLRRNAYESGWPVSISRQISVSYEDGHFYTKFPEGLVDDVLDLEYGTQNNPPKPVIRPLVNRSEEHMEKLETALNTFLDGVI